MAQEFVGSPILGQFNRAAANIAMILLELRLKAAEQGKSISGRPCEAGKNLVLVKAADFLGGVLDDSFAKSDLAVSCHDHLAVTADTQHGRRSYQSLRAHERNFSL